MEKQEKKYYTEDLIEGAIDDLQDRLKDEEVLLGAYDTDDLIAEIADNNIPIYTYDLLQYASNNFDLIQTNDLCLNSSYGDVVQIIQANIYEILTEELYAYMNTIQDKEKETEKE